jgi:hypothetical protein
VGLLHVRPIQLHVPEIVLGQRYHLVNRQPIVHQTVRYLDRFSILGCVHLLDNAMAAVNPVQHWLLLLFREGIEIQVMLLVRYLACALPSTAHSAETLLRWIA